MIWVIEFRSGSYLQQNGLDSGTLAGAKRFDSEREAGHHIDRHEWLALNGGMAKKVRASRHTDLDLAARTILDKLPPGALPTVQAEWLHRQLENLARAIWTQGWDCREEQGPLAGAFGHASRYNPYNITIKGSESIPGDTVVALQIFPEKCIPLEDVLVSVQKLRDTPIPNLEERGSRK